MARVRVVRTRRRFFTVTSRYSPAVDQPGQENCSTTRRPGADQRAVTVGTGVFFAQATVQPPGRGSCPRPATVRRTMVAPTPATGSIVSASRFLRSRSGFITNTPSGVASPAGALWMATWIRPLPRKK